MNQKTKTILFAAIIITALVTITTVAALYTMRAPNSPDVVIDPEATPTPTPTATLPPEAELSQVQPSVTSATVGDSITLSTTVSDHLAGITVTFYNQNDVAVGAAVTNSAGIASISIMPPEGTWSFYATGTHP
jgi:hypothetical protein